MKKVERKVKQTTKQKRFIEKWVIYFLLRVLRSATSLSTFFFQKRIFFCFFVPSSHSIWLCCYCWLLSITYFVSSFFFFRVFFSFPEVSVKFKFCWVVVKIQCRTATDDNILIFVCTTIAYSIGIIVLYQQFEIQTLFFFVFTSSIFHFQSFSTFTFECRNFENSYRMKQKRGKIIYICIKKKCGNHRHKRFPCPMIGFIHFLSTEIVQLNFSKIAERKKLQTNIYW